MLHPPHPTLPLSMGDRQLSALHQPPYWVPREATPDFPQGTLTKQQASLESVGFPLDSGLTDFSKKIEIVANLCGTSFHEVLVFGVQSGTLKLAHEKICHRKRTYHIEDIVHIKFCEVIRENCPGEITMTVKVESLPRQDLIDYP